MVVTLPSAVSLATVLLALYLTFAHGNMFAAPRGGERRWFFVVALSACLYSGPNALLTLGVGDEWVVLCSRLSVLAAAVHVAAWTRYAGIDLTPLPRRIEHTLIGLSLGLGVLFAIPGVGLSGHVALRPYPPLGVVYHVASATAFGGAIFGVLCLLLLVTTARYFFAARAGVAHARAHLAALGVLLGAGIHDSLASLGHLPPPFILDLGFFVTVGILGRVMNRRWTEDVTALDELSRRLDAMVAERTRALNDAEVSLARAEKLAAIGQLAAGVAHEINNPAGIVRGNLEFLIDDEELQRTLPEEARKALRDSFVAIGRVARIVRQLLDAGRAASSDAPMAPFDVGNTVALAVEMATRAAGDRAEITCVAAPGIYARGRGPLLEQVVVNLVVNAVQAGGTLIDVSVTRDGDRAKVIVADDGSGMTPEVRAHVFEPFYTTKPVGVGTGLGLAVSLGLMRSMGGDILVESTPGEGTTMTAVLEATDEVPNLTPRPVDRRRNRRRLLVVDDDRAMLEALRRSLGRRYEVEVASGVTDALARVRSDEDFDAVLCDVMMPDGGGEGLYTRLAASHPALASRTVFFSGGARTDEARRFLEKQSCPVLGKPLDPALLGEEVERLVKARSR